MSKTEENTEYDRGYFQALRDIAMIFTALTAFYNAKDVQVAVQQIKDAVYKPKKDYLA